MKKLLQIFTFLIIGSVFAQDYEGIISSYLNENRSALNFETEDVDDVKILSQSFSKSMQLQNVYASQYYNGIEIFNSVGSFAVKNNVVVSAGISSLQKNVATRVNANNPSLSASSAVSKAAIALGINSPNNLQIIKTISDNQFVFSDGGISLENIPVKLVYANDQNNQLRLAWDLSIYTLDASHYYSVRIDALTGELIDQLDWVVSCDFGKGTAHSQEDNHNILFKTVEENTMVGASAYRVFPLPYRNPFDGDAELVSDPADANASPFGWHDTDGVAGAEYTITRGNNVLAQEDLNGNNGSGASPDGGASLNFDFPYNLPNAPSNFTDAATVNLFYWNNIIHDVTHYYGFDEASGNFQEMNYGLVGFGSDSVNADAQDGGGTNNANFATPPDGFNPRMQMYIWDPSNLLELLTINNGSLSGSYAAVAADFGAPMPGTPLTADLAVVEDDNSGTSTDPNDACDPITNGGDLSGKIAIIRRGECEFGFKALAAEDEGAVAVIVVNNVAGDPIVMAPGAVGASVTIPCIMVNSTDGEALIAEAQANTTNGSIQAVPIGSQLDGDLDNEIIAHEYAHGVSNRLTGGALNTNCLGNDEQMGEGWSDYLGLILTMQADDTRTEARGLGNYASGRGADGSGIREAPYSTDFSVNDYTYNDINGNVSVPHGVGFVWNTMLWEMTWDLIDEYGFDPDIYNGTGGNNIALQLVIDGMKLQSCNPGFVDGRDAILEADELANGGANRCLIWNAFARRGLGLSASQGSSFSLSDGTEGYDVPEDCQLGYRESGFENNFKIYPNPARDVLNIVSKVSLSNATVAIYDINGRMVHSQASAIENSTSVNVSQLTAGIYLVKISGDSYSQTSKLIIQ